MYIYHVKFKYILYINFYREIDGRSYKTQQFYKTARYAIVVHFATAGCKISKYTGRQNQALHMYAHVTWGLRTITRGTTEVVGDRAPGSDILITKYINKLRSCCSCSTELACV